MSSDRSSDIRAVPAREISCGKCQKVLDVSALTVFSKFDCPHCGTRLSVPAIFGGFLLLEPLGSGGMGAVYRALDQSLGRLVAIKVMKGALGADAGFLQGFLREARAAAALNHPNIVQVYASGQVQGQPYIVMELVSGGRLDQLMESGPVPETRVLDIALDVAEGLKAAGDAGLVHSDIKPGNILFDKRGTAKIADFGLAQFMHRQQEREGIWGTPFYIAPEVAKGQRPDHRSDLYSLGATLFHALAGEPPFDGKTPADVVLARLNQPAPELYGRKGLRISGSTSRVIARMLELDAARRYPSWASLQADIREAQSRKNPATVAGRGPSTATHAKKEQARGPGRWIAMGAAVVLLVGVGIALAIARREKAETGSKPAPPQTAPAASVTDQAVLPLSILGDLAMATRRFAEGKAPAMDRELMKLIAKKDQIPAGGGSALWIELIRGMANMSAASRLVYIDQIKAIADTKPGENDRAAAMAIDIAGFVQGTLPAADFEKRAGSWPGWVGEFADLMRGLELIIGGSFDEGMNRCSRFAKSTGGKPEWVENLRTKFAKDQEKIAPVMQALPELKALAAKGPSKELSDRVEALKQDQPRYVQAGLDALIPAPPKAAAP